MADDTLFPRGRLMLGFFRCVAEAVACNGVAGLVELIPGGAYLADVAGDAWKRWRQKRDQKQLRDEVEQMAVASFEQARDAAKEAAREVAAGDPTLERDLELYLTQIPAAVRQSLKRPDDLTGTTVPADFHIDDENDVAKFLPPRMPRFRPGDAPPFLRGWVLEEQIGAGGFGEVWRGRNKRTPSLLGAFKFGHSLNERDFSLLNEGDVLNQVMAQGEHAGIVTLRDVWADGDELPWLRFEYIPGGDLTGLIHAWQTLPPEERVAKAVAALRELAETVGYFHGLNPAIVHRDLKPSNILVAGGKLKVADFGIGAVSARRLLAGEAAGSMSHGARLQSYLRGSHTPLYASPEQRDPKHKPHARDDVHALGVIGFQMITGHLNRGVGADFEEELLDFGATPELANLLKRCVATKADRRPKDARELAGLLPASTNSPTLANPVPVASAPTRLPEDLLSSVPASATILVNQLLSDPALVHSPTRPNSKMPTFPPGLAMDQRTVPVFFKYVDIHKTSVQVQAWVVPDGDFVGNGMKIADIIAGPRDGSRERKTGVLVAPATGILRRFKDAGGCGYHSEETLAATIQLTGEYDTDWSAVSVNDPPRPIITLTRSGDGVVYPGDHAWAALTVQNTGRGDLVQVNATVRSANPTLAKWQTAVGRVKPGDKIERCLAAILPLDTPPGELRGELVFTEGNNFPIPARPIVFTVHPLPRPDFTTRWTLVNDGSGQSHGNGDGKPKRGEYVDLAVTVQNQTGEDFEWLFLTLRPRELPEGVRITAPRGDLGQVENDGSAEGRVSFAVDPNAKPGPATFELRVESTDGRTFAVEPIEVAIG